jgi:hypothetical protein
VAFDCTSQEKAAHGHVVHAVQEVPFWAPFDAVFDTSCPGNERCAVESLLVALPFSGLARPTRHRAPLATLCDYFSARGQEGSLRKRLD